MKGFFLVGLLIFSITATTTKAQSVERPKLVVGIVIDQMRWDYLYRYYDRYTPNGFKKLMNEGFSCDQTFINYLPAYTAPGHACIYTGSVPSIHGIAGNDWVDNQTGRHWYCTEDTLVTPVGGSIRAGKMSPANMHSSTITDELRLATNFRSRVFGISLKDRGAILPAGHLGNGAFWYDDSTGSFISSSYYAAQLPDWLSDYNSKRLSDSFLAQDWTLRYPANTYVQSLPDNNKYEGKFSGEQDPVFPHLSKGKRRFGDLRRLPFGNTYTLMAAKACVEGEKLGKGTATDFLCISLSSPDYIGHQFTPNSVEAEDSYLRLDEDIASFLSFLDKRYGRDNYLVFLTADHGGAHNANYLNDLKTPAGNENETMLREKLGAYLKEIVGEAKVLKGIENYQIFLDREQMERLKIDEIAVKAKIRQWLEKQPQIAYVIDMENLNASAVPEPIRTMAINGYNRLRSGSLLMIYNPGWYHGYGQTGTTHGTWHPYDTHLPLLWYGWKIKKGSTNRRMHMEDIAATLAAMLKIQMPNGCIGEVITEVAR